MRVFETKWFARFARKQKLDDRRLLEAVSRAGEGMIDADLGKGLIKQRVARAGAGKSGGYRTIIALRAGDRAIFIYGFAKSERDNVDEGDLERLQTPARELLGLSDSEIDLAVKAGKLTEIKDEENLS